jgi:hypothetical protein
MGTVRGGSKGRRRRGRKGPREWGVTSQDDVAA